MQAQHIERLDAGDTQLPYDIPAVDLDYWGMREQPNLVQDVTKKSLVLDEAHTNLLFDSANRAFSTEPVELLLAGVYASFALVFSDRSPPAIFAEGHGREPWDSSVDLSRTVGWFTTLQPLALELPHDASLVDVARHMKDTRRKLPHNAWAVFTGHVLQSRIQDLFGGPLPLEIVFNFAGAFQQLERQGGSFSMASTDALRRGDHGPKLRRLGLFEFELYVQDGSLHVTLSWSRQMQHSARIERWMTELKETLATIAQTFSQRPSEFTLSDFPLLQVVADDSELQKLIDDLPSHGVSDLSNIETIHPSPALVDLFLLEQVYFPMNNNLRWTVKLRPAPGKPKLDPEGLLSAWQKVIDRHASLRTICVPARIKLGYYQFVVIRKFSPQVFQLSAGDDEEARRVLDEYPSLLYPNEGVPKHGLGLCVLPNGDIYCRLELNHAHMVRILLGIIPVAA